MAYFLETIKRMLEEFIELENFKLISLKNNGDVLEFQWEEFEKKEQSFAFARNFNRIRQSNYKKYYSETA